MDLALTCCPAFALIEFSWLTPLAGSIITHNMGQFGRDIAYPKRPQIVKGRYIAPASHTHQALRAGVQNVRTTPPSGPHFAAMATAMLLCIRSIAATGQSKIGGQAQVQRL